MKKRRTGRQDTWHSKKDLYWYAEWRPRIWSKVIGDTFTRLGWHNLEGKRVLEIGYGSGRMAVMFARHGALYLGYEINERKAPLARKTVQQAGVSERTEFRTGDFMQLEETFDYVFVKSVLYHIREEEMYRQWLAKINSLLASGGNFIALENAISTTISHWIRKILVRRLSWIQHCLYYSPFVEQIFRETFAHIDAQYFYVWSHLTPWPGFFSTFESWLTEPDSANCFAVGLICEKKQGYWND